MGILADTLVARGGYNRVDAENAERGPRAEELAREFSVAGGGGGNPVDQLIQNSINAYQQELEKYQGRSKEFDERNPFVFDEVLKAKRLQVADRLDPYYNQTLEDFLRGVNLRRTRSLEDERRVLSELTADVEDYSGRSQDILKEAISKSNQGFADANLFFSGLRLREEGKLRAEQGQGVEDVLKQAGRTGETTRLGTARTLEDLALQESQKKRDIKREKFAETEKAALSETNLAQLRRDVERSQFIGPPYASQSLSALPTTFLNYTS